MASLTLTLKGARAGKRRRLVGEGAPKIKFGSFCHIQRLALLRSCSRNISPACCGVTRLGKIERWPNAAQDQFVFHDLGLNISAFDALESPLIISRLIRLYFSKEHARPASGAFGMRNSFLGWNRLALLHLLLLPVTATITG
jgi:hypothetical protein